MYQSKATIVLLVLMLVFAGQASATTSFKKCFAKCVLGCVFSLDKPVCVAKCLAECVLNKEYDSSSQACNYGCAMDQCAKFGDGMYHLINSILYIHVFLLLSIP